METEIQKIVEEYLDQVELKMPEITVFKEKIDSIISHSKKELADKVEELEKQFEAGTINEEEYLASYKETKGNVLEEAKQDLDLLILDLPQSE